jgi:hypothetical protein
LRKDSKITKLVWVDLESFGECSSPKPLGKNVENLLKVVFGRVFGVVLGRKIFLRGGGGDYFWQIL